MPKITSGISFLLIAFLVVISKVSTQEIVDNPYSADQAIIVLSSNTLSEMQNTRRLLEKQGCRIRNVFPPSALIAHVPQFQKPKLETSDNIQLISYDIVSATNFETSIRDAIGVWNHRLQIHRGMISDTTGIRKMSGTWNTAWNSIDNQNYSETAPKTYYGRTYGADYKDTSLYMIGEITAVIVFMLPPKDDPLYIDEWKPGEKEDSFAVICNALDQFIDDEPNARLIFTFIKENNDSYISNEDGYVNYLRVTYNTHWAYIIYDFKRSKGGEVQIGRPCALVSTYGPTQWPWLWFTVRHETLHLFGAADQYEMDNISGPTSDYGYLHVVNANSVVNFIGYFDGKGEGEPDIMALNTEPFDAPIGVFTRGQIGWRDSDGDGILDPMDTYPHTGVLHRTRVNPYTYMGTAYDIPFLSDTRFSFALGGVTINTILQVEYRLNGGGWCAASPVDGAFDSGEEAFTFTLPLLKNGRYLLEVRATNSIGNVEKTFAHDWISVVNSSADAVRPFAAFSIRPPQGSIYTTYQLDASSSGNVEKGSDLQVRWNMEDTWSPFSFNKVVNYRFTTPGIKIITLQAMNAAGQIHEVSKTIEVAENDIPPTAVFVATPENQHGRVGSSFKVDLNAVGSYDGEEDINQLQFRWDVNDDGIWEKSLTQAHVTYAYPYPANGKSQHHRIRLEVADSAGHASQANRDVWIVPYNHTPVLKGIKFTYESHIQQNRKYVGMVNPLDPRINYDIYFQEPFYRILVSGQYVYLLSTTFGLHIIDVSAPTQPEEIGSLQLKGGGGSQFSIHGNYAYISVIGYPSGLAIVDIADPYSPSLVKFLPIGLISNKMYIQNNYLYVHVDKNLIVIDISTPTEPKRVNAINLPEVDYRYYLYMAGAGNLLYVAYDDPTRLSSRMLIFDVQNPQTPMRFAQLEVPNESPDQQILSLYIFDHYGYVGYYSPSQNLSGLYGIDWVSSKIITSPGKCTFPGVIENQYFTDDYAYVIRAESETEKFLTKIDIRNPQFPIIVNDVKWDPLYFNDFCAADKYIYCTDSSKGFIIYQPGAIQDKEVRVLTGIKANALAQDPDGDAAWNGPLEYRWDFGNDGLWDTAFSADSTVTLPETYFGSEITCQVRDKFGATETFSAVAPKELEEK